MIFVALSPAGHSQFLSRSCGDKIWEWPGDMLVHERVGSRNKARDYNNNLVPIVVQTLNTLFDKICIAIFMNDQMDPPLIPR